MVVDLPGGRDAGFIAGIKQYMLCIMCSRRPSGRAAEDIVQLGAGVQYVVSKLAHRGAHHRTDIGFTAFNAVRYAVFVRGAKSPTIGIEHFESGVEISVFVAVTGRHVKSFAVIGTVG